MAALPPASGPSVDDYDFTGSSSGASDTYPIEAGLIRKGGLMMIKGQPCKVSDVSTSKTGKHGSAKCNFTAYNIFNNKKLEDMLPSSTTSFAPNISRDENPNIVEYTLVDINDEDFMTLMTEAGETREDLKLPDYPEAYAKELREEFAKGTQLVLTVLKAVGQEQVIAHKVEAEK